MSQMKGKAILTWEFITDVISWYRVSEGRTNQDIFFIDIRVANHTRLSIFIIDLLSMVFPPAEVKYGRRTTADVMQTCPNGSILNQKLKALYG